MIRRTFRGVIQLLGALGAGLAILVMLVAWRLSAGPISLAFLSPYVEEALNAEDGSFGVRFDDTILTWAGWDRTLDVRVLNVRVLGPGGAAVAVVPELSLSLSAQALLHGVVAPRSIELYRPSLQIVRREDGSLGAGFGTEETSTDNVAVGILTRFAQDPRDSGPMRYLSRIVIREADLFVVDRLLGTSWNAPNTEVDLRRDETGIQANMSVNLDLRDRQTHVTLLGGYERETGRLDFGVEFDEFVPAAFSELSPKLAPLGAVGMPFEGALAVSMTSGGTVLAVDFDVSAGAGGLELPAPLSQAIQVRGLEAKGQFDGVSGELELEKLTLDFGETGELVLPSSNGHRLPLRRIEAEGTVFTETFGIDLTSLEVDLRGPTLSARAAFSVGDGAQHLRADGALRNVPVDEIEHYWPRAWGHHPRKWVAKNLADGRVKEARAEVDLVSDDGGTFEIVKLTGDMTLEDFTIDYLSPMPKASHVSGTATFNEKQFDIAIEKGEALGLTLQEGALSFTGLDEHDQNLEVDLTIFGDVANALQLIDSPPLRLADKIGIDPASSTGRSNSRIRLKFPLVDGLTFGMVDVVVAARMADVSVAKAILGRSISGGELELRADNKGMVVTGNVSLGTIPGTLDWREFFDSSEPVRSTYVLRGTVDDLQRREELGLDFAPFSEAYLRGAVGAEVQWKVLADGQGTMDAALDLSDAELTFPQFGWLKTPGIPGTAQVHIALDREKITGVPAFSIAAGDMVAEGSLAIDPETGGLRRIDLDRLAYGRTDVKGALIPGRDGGWTVTVHGASFDFAPMFGNLFSLESKPSVEPAGPDLSFSVDLDRLWIGGDQDIHAVEGTLARTRGKWRAIKMSGTVGDGKKLEVSLEPGPDGGRLLTILGEDAGETLKTFGYYENMAGGTLKITGLFEDKIEGSPLRGRVSVDDFRIIRAPNLAKIVSILSLTGIVDALQGPGLGFAEMEVPFIRHDGVLTLKDARVTGASLGLTAEGKVYSATDIVDIQGTLVPAYALNAALGNIPLLGPLFSGGEKGGGIFAATYKISGPTESPEITVNPLSVLAPGIVRRLFGIFDEASPEPEAPEVPFEPQPPIQ